MEEVLPSVGDALVRLRRLRGLSRQECAERIGTTVATLAAAETGVREAEVEERLALLYAIDVASLREGFVAPVEGVAGATVFLLHGGYQDFDSDDLAMLDRGLTAGRHLVATASANSLLARLRFAPASPAGPRAADAARQGHSLARLVRNRLGLGSSPLGDLRQLLEVQLAAAVRVEPLVSEGLRAAAIVDVGRAAAAVLLAATDQDRKRNPLLARVYLAHELCHVLFDPSAHGSVRIILDDRLWDRTAGVSSLSPNQLMESRAKGFAAEFLLPKTGLIEVLGPPKAVADLQAAERLVSTATHHFGTPWEIATYHLKNHGFFADGLVKGLLNGPRSVPSPETHPTSLPGTGGEVSTHVLPGAPPEVAPAQDAARSALEALLDDVLHRVSSACAQQKQVAATSVLVDWLDDLMMGERIDLAQRTLGALDPKVLPPRVLTGALVVTRPARDALGSARRDLVEKLEAALGDRWGLSPERVKKTIQRVQ